MMRALDAYLENCSQILLTKNVIVMVQKFILVF